MQVSGLLSLSMHMSHYFNLFKLLKLSLSVGNSAVRVLLAKKCIQRAQPGNGLKHIAEGETTQTGVAKAMNIAFVASSKTTGCAPSMISDKGSNVRTNLELRTSDADKVNLENSQPNENGCYSDIAIDASRKVTTRAIKTMEGAQESKNASSSLKRKRLPKSSTETKLKRPTNPYAFYLS